MPIDRGYKTVVDTHQFMMMMLHKDFTLINVHIPYQGKIPGTNELLPFDPISELQRQLPKDKNAPIVVYCMGSYMGGVAARTLTRMGYTHITLFYNGMIGCQEQGGRLINRSKQAVLLNTISLWQGLAKKYGPQSLEMR